jgi:hypothetical protein
MWNISAEADAVEDLDPEGLHPSPVQLRREALRPPDRHTRRLDRSFFAAPGS